MKIEFNYLMVHLDIVTGISALIIHLNLNIDINALIVHLDVNTDITETIAYHRRISTRLVIISGTQYCVPLPLYLVKNFTAGPQFNATLRS